MKRKRIIYHSAAIAALIALPIACGAGPDPSDPESDPGATGTQESLLTSGSCVLKVQNGQPQQLIPEGDPVACGLLATTWDDGGTDTATCQPDGTFDVSNCGTNPAFDPDSAGLRENFEVVKPRELDDDRWGNARCSDGSPFYLIVRMAPKAQATDDWVIRLAGGGNCLDGSNDCWARATPDLAVSGKQSWTHGCDLGNGSNVAGFCNKPGNAVDGVSSSDPTENPDFAHANSAYLWYCDSGMFSGTDETSDPTNTAVQAGYTTEWYSAGRHNFRAAIEVLMQRFGLKNQASTRVLLAGGSAGGFGAVYNAPVLARRLSKPTQAGNVRLVSDAGIVPPFRAAQVGVTYTLPAALQNILGFNGTGKPMKNPSGLISNRRFVRKAYEKWGVHLYDRCEREQDHPSDCMYPHILAPYIEQDFGIPVLISSSKVDSVNGGKMHSLWKNNRRERYRQLTLESMKDYRWLFAGPPSYHTIIKDNGTWNPVLHNGAPSWKCTGWGPTSDSLRDLIGRFWNEPDPLNQGEKIVFSQFKTDINCPLP